jgi:hypothetical protein
MSSPKTLHLACLRSSPPPADLAYVYTCYQCSLSMFAGKILNHQQPEGPGHVKCPLEPNEEARGNQL